MHIVRLGAVLWTDAIAHLHPVLLHLPIGLFVALVVVELVRSLRKDLEGDGGRGVLVALLAITTPLSALSGWYLNEGGEYGGSVEWHERLGIGLAVITVLIAIAHWRRSAWYGRLLGLGFLVLLPAAHLGGELTHGEGFLLVPWRAEEEATPRTTSEATSNDLVESTSQESHQLAPEDLAEQTTPPSPRVAPSYSDVAPIFEACCTRCHGSRKKKGKLALHELDAILAGGEGGPVIVPGSPGESRMIAAMRLPLEEDEHMPPEGKRQPTPEELELLEAWITGLADGVEPPGAHGSESADASVGTEPVAEATPPEPEPPTLSARERFEAVSALRERLVHVERLAEHSDLFVLDFTAARLEPGEAVQLLAPLAPFVVEINLSACPVSDDDLVALADLPLLERLDLRRLPMEDGRVLDLGPLTHAPALRSLNVAGTELAAGSEEALSSIATLERAFLWGTGLDEPALAELARARPELELTGASAPSDDAIEVEPEVVFVRQEPERTEEAVATDLRPSNQTCPVSGGAVDPNYLVVHDGRVIGFCCSDCPKSFWEDPERFAARQD